jgi:tetratricopeptide (TPR) repeat protein
MLACAVLVLLAADAGRASADAFFKAGRYKEAALAYIELLRKTPNDPDLLDAAGRSLVGLAAPEQAIPFFEREIELRPLSLSAAQSLSEALLETGRFEEAHKLLTRITARVPADNASWARLGTLLYRNGYYRGAIEAFNHALAPGTVFGAAETRNRIEVLRAISLVEAGSSDEAAKALPRLLARPENSANLDLMLINVRLLYETGRYDEALKQSDRALAAAPTNSAIHFWRARLFQQKSEIAQAVSEAEQSRELAPSSPAPHGLLVRLYRKSGRGEEAAREAAWLREHETAGEHESR